MAEIKMSYIFIKKQKHESKEMQEILLGIIDDVVQERTSDTITVNDVEIEYRIIQKRDSERCFLEMSLAERENKAISALQVVDDAIFKSLQQKYYHSIRDYDGISESNCKLRQTSEKICQIKQNYTEIKLKAKMPKNQ